MLSSILMDAVCNQMSPIKSIVKCSTFRPYSSIHKPQTNICQTCTTTRCITLHYGAKKQTTRPIKFCTILKSATAPHFFAVFLLALTLHHMSARLHLYKVVLDKSTSAPNKIKQNTYFLKCFRTTHEKPSWHATESMQNSDIFYSRDFFTV